MKPNQIIDHLRNSNDLLFDSQESVLQIIEWYMGKLSAAIESGCGVPLNLANVSARGLLTAAGKLRVHAARCESVACEVERLSKELL